ncbi:ExbD/TolR family protein [Vreelandella utahensis]|uniref:ExbD/TolR family protein n=1 Tax=Vreelandella halophila TaxID=86177 RepID=UPI000986CE2C|nr:biopolymer transporter ExbD [Halomonas utahensis]
MRNRHVSSDQEDAELNMTPMIDIVFIMLIFFIVTTSFVKETGIEVSRPSADTAERKEKGSILVGVRADGEVWMDNRQIEKDAIRANVERMLAENPEASVVVVADENASSGILVQAIDQARQAGASGVSVAARQGE